MNAIGVSTLVIDGMTGRGFTGVGDNQAALGRLNFILDIYRSLDILAKHPRVDPARIVLIGFSRGGQAALYSSVNRFQELWNKSGVEFAAYVSVLSGLRDDLLQRRRCHETDRGAAQRCDRSAAPALGARNAGIPA